MSHSHSHSTTHDQWIDPRLESRLMRKTLAFLAPSVLLMLTVLVVTWPNAAERTLPSLGVTQGTVFMPATISTVAPYDCTGFSDPNQNQINASTLCADVTARISTGTDSGKDAIFNADPATLRQGLGVGDQVILGKYTDQSGQSTYYFQDFNRTISVWLSLGLLVLVVMAVGKSQGLRAIAGLAAAAFITFGYIIPRMAAGDSAIVVLLTTMPLLTIILLYGAHGYNLKSTAAILGTIVSTFFAIGSAAAIATFMSLTGMASEEELILTENLPTVDLRQLLIICMVVAGLGALNDVTVTQSSAVWELSAMNSKSGESVYKGAMRIGRDHVASSIYTIAFAYAGSSIVTLMLITMSNLPTSIVFNSELVAEELAFLVVGLGALILSMPITTIISSKIAQRIAIS